MMQWCWLPGYANGSKRQPARRLAAAAPGRFIGQAGPHSAEAVSKVLERHAELAEASRVLMSGLSL
ncbi:hypothetical protein [Hymenobacter endophyticus]|uniref:Uncharacterized protein n=1 Tax=Hymenobacter endophyticus TaxID=3076335 RepID=A0ABU3TE87_9BACT|nr:hypothetical protein [Hymenobacter endophyticus]MDU0369657.1 hypothetical protein [Hymenobacter endophyticus]